MIALPSLLGQLLGCGGLRTLLLAILSIGDTPRLLAVRVPRRRTRRTRRTGR